MRRALVLATVLGLSAAPAWSDWADSFDAYPAGSKLAGQGGWEIWYSGGGDVYVSNSYPFDGPNTVVETTGSNVVHPFNVSNGKWALKIYTYVPTSAIGAAYVILMNQYGDPSIDSQSMRVRFDADLGVVASEPEGLTLPLFGGQWAELRAEFNLRADTLSIYYADQPLSTRLVWSTHLDPAGIHAFAGLNLYSLSMSDYYCDAAVLMRMDQPGDGDMNCDGLFNAFDIDPFVQCIVSGVPTPPCTDCLMGDMNCDGLVNAFDIDPFIAGIINGGSPACP